MTTRTSTEIQAEIKVLAAQERAYDALVNEGGEGYNPIESKIEALTAELNAARSAEFAAEWTIETLNARRETWNGEIAKLAAANGGKIPGRAIDPLIARLGYSHHDIAKAKAIHGIM